MGTAPDGTISAPTTLAVPPRTVAVAFRLFVVAVAVRVTVALLFAFVWKPLLSLRGEDRVGVVTGLCFEGVLAAAVLIVAFRARTPRAWPRIALIPLCLVGISSPISGFDWIPTLIEAIGCVLLFLPSASAYSARTTTPSTPTSPGVPNPSTTRGLAIAGFVLAFFGGFNIGGLVLSIIAFRRLSRSDQPRGLAIAGIVIAAAGILMLAAFGIVLGPLFVHTIGICHDLGHGTHHVDGVTYTCS
jgi:hypothetical protein